VQTLPSIEEEVKYTSVAWAYQSASSRLLCQGRRRDIFLGDISLTASACNKRKDISWCLHLPPLRGQSIPRVPRRVKRHLSFFVETAGIVCPQQMQSFSQYQGSVIGHW